MLGKHRSTYDILAAILNIISKNPCSSTDLFHEIKSSYEVLKRNLDTAIRYRLAYQKRRLYAITPKGLEFVTAWKKLQEFFVEE